MSKPLIYLVLGAAGSGRREMVADLAANGLVEADRPCVLLESGEGPDAADPRLPALARWTWSREGGIAASVPAEATHVFLITNGRTNPVDQVEAFAAWVSGSGAELARILTVVDCRLAERHPKLMAWYEACVHFSDAVLLNHREGVANKWVSDFLTHFKKQFVPALFGYVKHGRVDHPNVVLVPEARRLSQIFDEDFIASSDSGPAHGTLPPEPKPAFFIPKGGERIEIGDEDEDAGEESPPEDDGQSDQDPYLARRHEGGRRVKEIPRIEEFLGG